MQGLTPRADTWASPHRLFDLEPDLLPFFQYNCRQFSSPEDCLSSPEFLDHIRKVRERRSRRGLWDPAEHLPGGEREPRVRENDFCFLPWAWSYSPPSAPSHQGHLLLSLCAELALSAAPQSAFSPALCSASWSQLSLPSALSPGSCRWCRAICL